MPAQHYALSELLIVGAALFGATRLIRCQAWAGALACVLFGGAAMIGALRYGLDLFDVLQQPHQLLSQVGGAAAMALIACQLAMLAWASLYRHGTAIALSVAIATAATAAILRDGATAIFVAWLVFAIVAAACLPARNLADRWVAAGTVAIFLVNVIAIRKSAFLGPDVSWHLFHVLVALWLVAVTGLIATRRSRSDTGLTKRAGEAFR